MKSIQYSLVVLAEAWPTSPDSFAIESAFAGHLRMLKERLGDDVDLVVASPRMPAEEFAAKSVSLARVERTEGITYFELCGGRAGPLRYLLTALPINLWRTLQLAKRSRVVHAGPSNVLRILEILSLLWAVLLRRRSIYVVDLDWRQSRSLQQTAGRLSAPANLCHRLLVSPFMALQTWLAVRFCSHVMFKSEGLVRDYGRGREHVRFILDAAHSAGAIISVEDLERRIMANASAARLELVYFGRLVPRKGVAHCIEAIRLARASGADCRLTVIGQGPDREHLKALAAEMRASVRFLDALPYGPELFAAVDRAQVLLAAPLSEDTPRSALDAMARGLAVVAYDIAYYQYLADASGAVVTAPFNDPAGLASAITKLARDRVRLASCMRSARLFAADNTQDIWMDRRFRWLDKYCGVVSLQAADPARR